MKRVFAILLVLAMVLSLGVTAFAAAEDTGSITLTNATYGKVYKVYKIFDADIRLQMGEDGQPVKDSNGNPIVEGIAYSIDKNNQFFSELFGEDGTAVNAFFTYNPNSGDVSKITTANDSELTDYLEDLLNGGNFAPADLPVVAVEAGKNAGDYMTEDELKALGTLDTDYKQQEGTSLMFSGLPYGYYMISSTLGTTVTITSNTPSVEVIDKNQEPATDFDKKVLGVDKDGKPAWVDANSAGMGDEISYQISFTATNFDGDKKIKFYQVHDEKGDAIWAEFNSIRVSVGGVELPRGYYLNQGADNPDNEWKLLGELNHEDGWNKYSEEEQIADNAQWYLVHLGYDTFRITIPWLEGHDLEVTPGTDGNADTFALKFPVNAASKFASPVEVVITYDAHIEGSASIGGTTHGNRFNKASASWTSEYETGNTPPDEVVTQVYGIGILKDDSATYENLADAKFQIFAYNSESSDYDLPVYVIPTGIEGVYAVDSMDKSISDEDVSGVRRAPTRTYFSVLRDASGNVLKDAEDKEIPNLALAAMGANQSNEVVTPVNGKVVILGLAAGTYRLIEKEAPEGYNAVSKPIDLVVNETTAKPFSVFVDKEGKVADLQYVDQMHSEYRYDLTTTTVHNSKGTVLPSTGGEGRIMLLTIGTMVAIGFAVLLITQKKMSAYRD